MNSRPHSRNGSHSRKVSHQAHVRPGKPPPLARRGKSYDANHPHAGGVHHHKAVSSSSSTKRLSHSDTADDSDAEPGMASFLQFCTTCERQIVTPSTSILYCSENCRKRDIGAPTPMTPTAFTPMTPSTTSYFDHYPAPDIIPQMTPTLPRPTPSSYHDLAFAEYRRASEALGADDSKSGQDSDAARSLSHFYAETSASNARRYHLNRSSTAGLESTIPSLVHSPSSSYGTVASNASYRPLPSRQNPFTSAFSTKSIDLVLPYTPAEAPMPKSSLAAASMKSSASTVTSFRVVEANDLSYNGRRASATRKASPTSEKETLSQLYNHAAIMSRAK